MTYKMPAFSFTHAAKVVAATRGEGEAELTSAAQAGVVELMGGTLPQEHGDDDRSPDDPMEIVFHCFDYRGDRDLIMSPGDGVMMIDVAEYQESEKVVETGPLAGVRMMMPRPFSEGSED